MPWLSRCATSTAPRAGSDARRRKHGARHDRGGTIGPDSIDHLARIAAVPDSVTRCARGATRRPMIGHLRGTLVEKTPSRLIVDVGGVGYEVLVPLSTFYALGE